MSRRLGQPSVVFPPNTVFLDFPRSDGDETKWPTNTTRIVDADGQVNFMELLDIDQSGQVRKWRASVGKAIATKLEMQGDRECIAYARFMPQIFNPPLAANNYVLRDWPRGYRMYDHHKGPEANPRHDLYLYGEHHTYLQTGPSSFFDRLCTAWQSVSIYQRIYTSCYLAFQRFHDELREL